jgi:26S proteasome regulatory subunit T4
MRQHEVSSESLKNRKQRLFLKDNCRIDLSFMLQVRFSLKDLEKAFEKTEDDIKAVQSVGQIIGEVMKQLDDERCAYFCCARCHN